jgi:hypothetical protein
LGSSELLAAACRRTLASTSRSSNAVWSSQSTGTWPRRRRAREWITQETQGDHRGFSQDQGDCGAPRERGVSGGADHIRVLARMIQQLAEQIERLAGAAVKGNDGGEPSTSSEGGMQAGAKEAEGGRGRSDAGGRSSRSDQRPQIDVPWVASWLAIPTRTPSAPASREMPKPANSAQRPLARPSRSGHVHGSASFRSSGPS